MRRLKILCLVTVTLLFLAGCSNAGTMSSPLLNPKKAKDSALAAACVANMRAIYAGEQAYNARNDSYASLAKLEEFQGRIPAEPSGGSYSVDTQTGRVTCSAGHGSIPE